MNEETKVIRSKLEEAQVFLQPQAERDEKAIEAAVSEAGVLLETFLPKWKGLVVAHSLPDDDAAALARTALDLLTRYERLIERAESAVGPLEDVPRGVFVWRDFWCELGR